MFLDEDATHMNTFFHTITICAIFLLMPGATGVHAQSSTANHSRHATTGHSRPKHKQQFAARIRPAVIDTSCLDTIDAAHQTMIKEINKWSSVRYKKGGVTLKGADCSGFVLNVFKNSLTMSLPRTSREQAAIGEEVERDSLRFGDLIFFYKNVHKKNKRIGHVGIYIGEGNFVHSSKHKGVGVDALSGHYYDSHFAQARRIADITFEPREENESIPAEK